GNYRKRFGDEPRARYALSRLILRSARVGGASQTRTGVRASRRMRTAVPPHASGRRLRRLLSMRGITIARAGRRAKPELWLSLFSSCSGLLSTARRGEATRKMPPARISLLHTPLTRHAKRRVVAGRLFFPCYLQETAPRRGSPSHVAAVGADHYLTRVGGGAVEGPIPHGVVATVSKPGTGGRARASRLRAAGGARPMQGRRPHVVEHARALHHRRRAGRDVGGICARRLPPSDQAGLRR